MTARLKMKSFAFGALMMFGMLTASGGRAEAEIVTLNFTGTITTFNDPRNVLGLAISPGDTFTGSFAYDSALTDRDADPNFGFYVHSNLDIPLVPPLGLFVRVGTAVFQPVYGRHAFGVEVHNNQPASEIGTADGIQTLVPTSLGGVNNISGSNIIFALADATSTLFSSDALPTSLSTSSFTHGVFRVYVPGPTPSSDPILAIEGTLDGLQAVPEPGSLTMLALGGIGMIYQVRRRRTHRLARRPA